MHGPRIVRAAAVIAVIALTAFAIAAREHLGVKHLPVSIRSIVLCLVCSALAAYGTTRAWHWFPAPFLAGIAGVIAGGRFGPAGGVFGFVVGLAVAATMVAQSRLEESLRRQE
jgi:hypothetical protein